MKNEDVVRLFDAYADDLYRFAVYYSGSKHDAEDIVQDVFLKLLGDHVEYKPGKEKTYLFTMTANKCRDYLRSASRKTGVDLESCENELQYFDDFNERNRAVFDELMNLDGQFRIFRTHALANFFQTAMIFNVEMALIVHGQIL